MLMRLRMLKLSVGKGHQVIKQLCCRVLQYYAIVATERAGYVLYRALVYYSCELGPCGGGTLLNNVNCEQSNKVSANCEEQLMHAHSFLCLHEAIFAPCTVLLVDL